MKNLRTNVPTDKAAQLLFHNRHQCCVCHEPRKAVHIHHIDEDSGNNDWDNLAVLCLDHHSDVTGSQGFGRNYSQEEILLFKQHWEAECESWRQTSGSDAASADVEIVEPIETIFKVISLKEGEDESYSFDLEEGDEIAFSVSSDEPIDVLIMTERQYKRWSNQDEVTPHEEHEATKAIEDSFVIPRDGWWTIVFHNSSDDPAEVQYDVATWPSE